MIYTGNWTSLKYVEKNSLQVWDFIASFSYLTESEQMAIQTKVALQILFQEFKRCVSGCGKMIANWKALKYLTIVFFEGGCTSN